MLAGSIAAAGLGGPVFAQSITGGLHGTAPVESGLVIVVTSPETGYAKNISVGAQGHYDLGLLAPGVYEVRLERAGKVLARHTVRVSPNVSVPVPAFALESAANGPTKTLETVQVMGQNLLTVINPIDVSTPELSTVWSANLLHDIPTNQTNPYTIPMLSSNVQGTSVQGEAAPVVNGAGPSENRYYYNEFDATYDVSGVGATILPQEAVTSTQFVASNASLQWTPTTGGIVSSTIRQGGNQFHFGYSAYYQPPTSRLLRPRGPDTYYQFNGNTNHYIYQSANHSGGQLQNYLWASGPIVKNKLFFFAMGGAMTPSTSTGYGGASKSESSPRNHDMLVNLTWNPTDNQSLDVAAYRLATTSSAKTYALDEFYNPASAQAASKWNGRFTRDQIFIGNYHWRINDHMQLRLMAGYLRFDDVTEDEFSDQAWSWLWDGATGINQQLSGGASQIAPNHFSYLKRGYKGDFTWELGDHKVTLGGEKYSVSYFFLPQTVAAGMYQYLDVSTIPGAPGSAIGNGGFVPANGLYGWSQYQSTGGSFLSRNYGFYLFDNWQVTKNVVVTGGLRFDRGRNLAANGVTYMDLKTTSPRIGLSWDVHGDSSLKIGANAGKFTLPLPSNLSYLTASATTNYTKYFSFTGINPDGTPQGYQQLGDTIMYQNGSVPRLETISSKNLENTYQYEFQVYAQKQLSPAWSLLAAANVSTLKNLIDQTCDQTGAIGDYVRSQGHPNYPGLPGNQCIEFNPGRPILLRDDLDANGKSSEISIPNSYLGMPPASRKYRGVTFTLSHARTSDAPYFLSLSYTWSHLYGNSSGYVNMTKSGDARPGYSGNYTFREITAGSYGNLAADVRHSFNAVGVYYFPGGLQLGGVWSAGTGAPQSCLGTYPDPNNSILNSQGAVTHYCNGKLVTQGSTWRTPFFWQLDLSVAYDFRLKSAGQLTLSLNVFNVTNRSGVTGRNMVADSGQFRPDGSLVPSPTYFLVNSLQGPRSTMMYLRYRF